MSDNETVDPVTDVSSSQLKKWWPVILKVGGGIILSVAGFLGAWLFHSVVGLREDTASLKKSIQEVQAQKQMDRDQWRAMSKLNDRIARSEIETEVNRRVQQTLIDIIVLKNFGEEMLPPAAGDDDDAGDEPPPKIPPPRLHESKDLLERLNEMQKPTDVDDYIRQEQTVLPRTKK